MCIILDLEPTRVCACVCVFMCMCTVCICMFICTYVRMSVYTYVHMYECKYVYACLCLAGENLVLWSLVLSLHLITTSCLCLQMDVFFPAWLLLLLVQGCTTGDTVEYVRTYVRMYYAYVACMKFNLSIVWPNHHLSFHMQSCFNSAMQCL